MKAEPVKHSSDHPPAPRARQDRIGRVRVAVAAVTVVAAAVVLPVGIAAAQAPQPTAPAGSDADPDLDAGLAGLGVAPSFLVFDDVLRGTTYTDSIILMNGLQGDREFSFTPTGDVAGWISFEDQDGDPMDGVVLPHQGSATVRAAVAVPADAPNGEYRGRIEISGRPAGVTDADSGSGLAIGAVVEVAIAVGGEMVRAGNLIDVQVAPAEVGRPVSVEATFVNSGNVGFAPSVEATITRSGLPVEVLSSPGDETIDPGRSESVALVWDSSEALPGTYAVRVVAVAEGYDFAPVETSFELAAAGSVERSGALESLELVSSADAGGIARIRGQFRNESQVPVQVVLVGEVSRDGRAVGEVQSLERLADATNVTPIDVVVENLEPGAYTVIGHANFEGRETERLEVTFTVADPVLAAATGASGSAGDGPSVALLAGGIGAAALVVGVPAAWLLRRRRGASGTPSPA